MHAESITHTQIYELVTHYICPVSFKKLNGMDIQFMRIRTQNAYEGTKGEITKLFLYFINTWLYKTRLLIK